MRAIACLLAMTTIAVAEPTTTKSSSVSHEPRLSVGVAKALTVERMLAVMTNLAVGWRFQPGYWIDAAVGFGRAGLIDPTGSGQGDSSAYESRVGVARLWWRSSVCGGFVGSVGYHHQSVDFADGLLEPPSWTETRDLGFGELRAVGRLRLFPGLAIEAALAARIYHAFHVEHTDDGSNAGIVGSIGLHATL